MSEKMTEIKEAFEFAKLSAESFGAEVTIKPELIDSVLSLLQVVEEQRKALTIVRGTLEHRKHESRTDFSLWSIANEALGKDTP
jgi:hypothetical protein